MKMLWSPEVETLTGDQSAASTTLHAKRSNHDDEERYVCQEGCDAGNLLTSHNLSTSTALSEESSQDRTPNLIKGDSKMLECQSNGRSLQSDENGVVDGVDKKCPREFDPDLPPLISKEKHRAHSDVDATSIKSSQVLNPSRGHDGTPVARGNDITEEEEEKAESDSGSEFEWKPVKCSKTRENEVEWEARRFSTELQENCHDNDSKHFVKRLKDDNKEGSKEEHKLNMLPSLSPSLSTQAADGVSANEGKKKHSSGQLLSQRLLVPLEQERNFTHYRAGSSARSKKKALPRPHSGKHRLPTSEMDDATYLTVFGIDKILSNLAMALLEQKPKDHKSFTKKWIEHLIDMGRKGEKKEGLERQHSLHSHHNSGKKGRNKHFGSPGVLNLGTSGTALPPSGYAGSTTYLVSPRGDQLTKRRLREVLKTELDTKRGSWNVNEYRSFDGIPKKPEQGQTKTISRARSEFRREHSHDSESSDKDNLKKRRCSSKAKISDKVNDYLNKVELTRDPAPADSLTVPPLAAVSEMVDTPSSMRLGTSATEDYKGDGTLPSTKSKKSPSSFRSNNFTDNHSSLPMDIPLMDDGKGNNLKSILSRTVDPNLTQTHSPSNEQATIHVVDLPQPVESLNTALDGSPISFGGPRAVSPHGVEREEETKGTTDLGDTDKTAEANLFALSPISNSLIGAPPNNGSEVTLAGLKEESKMGVSKLDSLTSSSLLQNLKNCDGEGEEDQMEANEDVDNALVTFAPVITLDQSTSGLLGGLRISSETKNDSFNSQSLPPTSGQVAAASTASNLRTTGAINAGRESAANTRSSRLTTATAEIPAKLLAAIAPTTISNANRAAQQKLANSGITVSGSGSTTSKLGVTSKIPLAATSTGSEANLASSRNTALNAGFSQGSATATIGSARLKLHSLVGGGDTMAAKSKLAFLRGTGEHSNPTLQMTTPPQSMSPSASPLNISRLQPHTFQPYNNSCGSTLTANQNTTGSTIFPILQPSLYTTESNLDNKVDLVPFSSIEYNEKGTSSRENLIGKLSSVSPMDLCGSCSAGGAWPRGVSPFIGTEGETQAMMMAVQNSFTDVDAPSPRVSSMLTGSNVALAMGSSSSTGFNFSPMNSLLKRRGDSVLASESGGIKVIPDRFLTPTESFLTSGPSETFTRINSILGQIPKGMYSNVLSYLEGLVGKTDGGDTSGSRFPLSSDNNGAAGLNARASLRTAPQYTTPVNFGDAMCAAASPIDAALRYQEGHHGTDSAPSPVERLPTLSGISSKSTGMRHVWSSPTLTNPYCEEALSFSCGVAQVSGGQGTNNMLKTGGHSPSAEASTDPQIRVQVNPKGNPAQKATQMHPLQHDPALAPCGKTPSIQDSIRAFASSIARSSQSQAAISISSLSQEHFSLPQRPVGEDANNAVIDTTSEKTSPYFSNKVKCTLQTALSPSFLNLISGSINSCNKEEGAPPVKTHELPETDKHQCEAPHAATNFDQPIDNDHTLEAKTAFDTCSISGIEPLISPMQSEMSQIVHTATAVEVSESESRNPNQQTSTEGNQEKAAKEGVQKSTHGELTMSLEGNNDRTDNYNDSLRSEEREKSKPLSPDENTEITTQQNQDSPSNQKSEDISSIQQTYTDLNPIRGDKQITTKDDRTQPECLPRDEALIDTSRPPKNEMTQPFPLQASNERINHKSEDKICIPFNNSALKEWLSTKPECIILSSGNSQLATAYDANDSSNMREPDNSEKLSRTAPSVSSKCSENSTNSPGRSPAYFAQSMFFPPIKEKTSRRTTTKGYHSDTPQKFSHHRSHRHCQNCHKRIQKGTVHHPKRESGNSTKMKLSGSGGNQSHDNVEHEPFSECDIHSLHNEIIDVMKPSTPLCQSCISDTNTFPNKTACPTNASKKRQSRSVSLNFGDTIYTFPKLSKSAEDSRRTDSGRMKRSLSAVLNGTELMCGEENSQHRKQQQCHHRAHYKCNASSFSDHLSEEGLEKPEDGKSTLSFPSPQRKKSLNNHHSHCKHELHFSPCHLPKAGGCRPRTNSQGMCQPFNSKDVERSLLERTMEFMNRRGHLDMPNYPISDFHDLAASVKSPLYALGDTSNRSPNQFPRGPSEKGSAHDPKLDYAIAMTALAVAEGELCSPCSSATSSDRLLDVADLIYSKQVQSRVYKDDCNRQKLSLNNHGIPGSQPQLSGPLSITNGADATVPGVVAIKTIKEESASHVDGEMEENTYRSSQNTCNREVLSDLTISPDLLADPFTSACEKFTRLSSKVSSSTCAEIAKGMLDESTITSTSTEFTSKDLNISSEELESLRDLISKNTIIGSFDPRHLRMLLRVMTRKVLNINDILVHEGEPWIESLVFVVKGSLSAICHENTSQEVVSGTLYGEVEFFENTKRSPVTLVSATAPSVTVLLLANKDFVNLVMTQKRALKVFLAKYIERIPLFQPCPDLTKCQLVDALKPHLIKQGTTLIEQGSPVEWLYIVLSGELSLFFSPEKAGKERKKHSTPKCKSLSPPLLSSGLASKRYSIPSKESSDQYYRNSSVPDRTDDMEQQSENHMQISQHSIDGPVYLTAKNDPRDSARMGVDSPIPYSSESSEDAKSNYSPQRFSALSLPTSIFVDNNKLLSVMPDCNAAQSDIAADQPISQPPRGKKEPEERPLPLDFTKGQFSLKFYSGSLVSEVEHVFRTKSLFTVRSTTALQVVRINRLHFDIIMSKEVIDIFKRVIVIHPMYRFLRKVAPPKMRSEMNSIGLNQAVGVSTKSESRKKTGSSLSSMRWFDGQEDKGSISTSQYRKDMGRKISKLAAVEQLPRFRKMPSIEKLSHLKSELQARNKSMLNIAATSSHLSHIQSNENTRVSKANTTTGTILRSYRSSNMKRASSGTSLWHCINPDGEIVFSGGRHLCRFPLEALCANNTIIIEIIMDGTIIQWNPIAHHVIGYAPFEVIGQNIFDLMSCEENRQKLQTMLKAANDYAGHWESYVAAELNLQKIFSFRQNTGLYQISVALSVIPSMCSSSSEVFLLVGRESKYHAAANYSADVVAWLNERMRPQLANFQYYVSYIESKKWMVTPNDAILLRGHLDACMVTVEHLARLSLLTMETVRDSLRPTQLIIPIRRFITEACALVRNKNCSLFCKTDDITPTLKVFLDAEKVIMFLRLVLKDLLKSMEYDPTTHVDIELRVTIIEPESTHLGQQLQQNDAQQKRQRQSSQQQVQDHNESSVNCTGSPNAGISLLGESNNALHANPSAVPQSVKVPSSAGSEPAKVSTGVVPHSISGDSKETKSSVNYASPPPQSVSSVSPASNAEHGDSIDLQLSSLRRICFELYDNGLTIPLFHSSNDMAREFPEADSFDSPNCFSKSFIQTVLTPVTRFGKQEMLNQVAPFNSPVVTNSDEQPFPHGGSSDASGAKRFANPRHRGGELPHVEKIVSEMGGMLRCFTRPEVEGNVVRVELPLLAVPGSKEDVVEDTGAVQPLAPGGRSFTVIVADSNHVHQNHLCQILWSRQHAVIPVRSFEELMRKIKSNTADILIIDPIQIDLNMDGYIKTHGSDPFSDILESTSRMVLVVVGMDFSDWRVQKLLDRNSVIEVPKLGSAALIHIAMQEAEQMVAEMRNEEARIEQLRSNFTNSTAGRHKIGRLLGKGTFGDVYEVKDTLTSGKMAMKRMQLHEGTVVDEVVQEILAMTSLQHDNIIRYFYCEKESDTTLRLYMELAPEGTLRDRIREQPGVGLPFEEIVQRLTGICRGLAYVHSQHYVHCDLKTANLLLGTHGRTKIGDFGTAKQLAPGQKLYKLLGTPQYMAPEVLMADLSQRIGYDYKADVWSVGCIALEMATGLPPFSHIEQSHGMGIIKYLSELTDTPDLSPLFSGNPLIYEFVKACLEINPEHRPSAQELLHFDILQGMGTSIRAERIMRRAEMLYKLNKYASKRGDTNEISNGTFAEDDSELSDSANGDDDDDNDDDGRGAAGGAQGYYNATNSHLRSSVSSSSLSESSFTSTSDSQSGASSNWSVESLQPTVSSKTM